jgi:hypothetical protein
MEVKYLPKELQQLKYWKKSGIYQQCKYLSRLQK